MAMIVYWCKDTRTEATVGSVETRSKWWSVESAASAFNRITDVVLLTAADKPSPAWNQYIITSQLNLGWRVRSSITLSPHERLEGFHWLFPPWQQPYVQTHFRMCFGTICPQFPRLQPSMARTKLGSQGCALPGFLVPHYSWVSSLSLCVVVITLMRIWHGSNDDVLPLVPSMPHVRSQSAA
jgi:hypothetical protein